MKYFFLNDISYLLHKRKKRFLVLFLPFIILFINLASKIPPTEIFNSSMGTNLNMSSNILEIAIFLLTISFNLYLISDVFSKDVEYQMDLIFLREEKEKWFIKKSIVLMGMVFSIRIFQYLFFLLIFLFTKNISNLVWYISIFIHDLLFICSIQYLFLFFYLLGRVIPSLKKILFFLFVLIFCLIPKNIVCLNVLFTSCLLVGLILANLWLIKKFSDKIFENL